MKCHRLGFLVSFLSLVAACGVSKSDKGVPFTLKPDEDGVYAGSAQISPGLGLDPRGDSKTPPIPAIGAPTEANDAGINAPPGMSVRQVASSFVVAYQGILRPMGFDPRSVPDSAKGAYRNYACAMKKARLNQLISGQCTLSEYVASLYVDVFRRTPESKEAIQKYAAIIQSSGVRAGVRAFLLSDEHLNKMITANYMHFFKRGPSEDELAKWRGYLNGHTDEPSGQQTLERMYANTMASNEFWKDVSKRFGRNYVIQLHRYLLQRDPSDELEVLKIWLHRAPFSLTSSTEREDLAMEFIESDEYRLKKLTVLEMRYFDTFPTSEELAGRLDGMKQGRDQLIIMTDLLTDTKYFERAHAEWSQFTQHALQHACD